MTQEQTISLVFASDDVTAMPLGAAIASVLMNRAPTSILDFHVLACGISRASRKHIDAVIARLGRGSASLSWYGVTGTHAARLNRFYTRSSRPYPPAAYARLLLGRLLPETLDRVIYMDADTIARSDLAPLWKTDFEGVTALVVRDLPHNAGQPERLLRTLSPQDRERYGVTADMEYFQSGVMSLDVRRIREGIGDEICELVERYPEFTFPDQDALNVALARSRRFVDPRWNQMSAVYWYDEATQKPYEPETFEKLLKNPLIVHYSGRPKPWEKGCMHPFADEWLAAHRQTPWAARRRTWVTRAVDRVPRARRVLAKKFRRILGV